MRRHLAWMASSQASFFVVQFIASLLLARLISPTEMGIYALAMAVSGALGILQATGLAAFVVREPDIDPELMASTFTLNALISVVVAALMAGISTQAGRFLHAPGVTRVMLVMAAVPVIGLFEFLPAANLEREAQFKPIALIASGRTIITQGLSVALAFAGWSYMSVAYGQVAGALFSAAAYNLAGRRFVAFRLRLGEWRRILRFGLQMLALSGVFALGGRLSDILLGRIVGLNALGLYGRAANLNNLIQENIYMVAVRVLFVDLAAQARSGQSLRGGYLATIEILTALLWPAFAGLAIVAGPFIRVAYGAAWMAAAAPLRMLALAALVHLTISLSWQLFVVRHEVARQTRIECIRTAAGVVLFGVCCRFGLTAAAAARIGEALFTVALYRPHIERMTQTRLADFLPIYRRSVLLTLGAVGPAAVVMAGHRWADTTPLLPLCAAIIAGLACWLGIAFWLDHPLARELAGVTGRILPHRSLGPAGSRLLKSARRRRDIS